MRNCETNMVCDCFFFQAEDGIRDYKVTGVQTCALPICMCYYQGEGVSKNLAEAAKWFRKAAEGGDPNAEYDLDVCYANNKGVAKDAPEAEIGRASCRERV